jgi:hypothetical protein
MQCTIIRSRCALAASPFNAENDKNPNWEGRTNKREEPVRISGEVLELLSWLVVRSVPERAIG